MWFKNLCLFRLDADWRLSPAELEQELSRHPLVPCAGLSMQSRGWLAPRDDGQLVCAQAQQFLIAQGIEDKLLPPVVVRQEAEERAKAFEEERGFKPARKQMRELRERVEVEMLPRAFVRRRQCRAWIDANSGWFVIDASSPGRAEEMVEFFRDCAPEAPKVRRPDTGTSVAAAMTLWLNSGRPPEFFSIDDECELQGSGETRATVRYLRHELDGEEIRRHIKGGKQVTRLALTWRDRISFVLTAELQIKRLRYLAMEADGEDENPSVDPEAQFELDFTLMTGELGALLTDLSRALSIS